MTSSERSLVDLLREIDQAWGDLTTGSEIQGDVITGWPHHYIINGDAGSCGCDEHVAQRTAQVEPTPEQLGMMGRWLADQGVGVQAALDALVLATAEFDRWGAQKSYTTCLQIVVNRKIREIDPDWTCFDGNWLAMMRLLDAPTAGPSPERF